MNSITIDPYKLAYILEKILESPERRISKGELISLSENKISPLSWKELISNNWIKNNEIYTLRVSIEGNQYFSLSLRPVDNESTLFFKNDVSLIGKCPSQDFIKNQDQLNKHLYAINKDCDILKHIDCDIPLVIDFSGFDLTKEIPVKKKLWQYVK